VADKPLHPVSECVRIAETGQIAPGADHRLLDGVARELAVAEDQAGGRVQPREAHVEESSGGVMLALPRSLDESSLVHGRLVSDTAFVVVLDSVWRPCRRKGSVGRYGFRELHALDDAHRLRDARIPVWWVGREDLDGARVPVSDVEQEEPLAGGGIHCAEPGVRVQDRRDRAPVVAEVAALLPGGIEPQVGPETRAA